MTTLTRRLPALLLSICAIVALLVQTQAQDGLKFHAAPKALDPDAKTADWPRFLGPTDDLHSPETHLLKAWPSAGPAKVWEAARGTGQASASVSGDRVVYTHLVGGEEVVECRKAETGEALWKFAHAVQAGSSYGTDDAPRCSPVIDGDLVFVLGLASDLHCLELATGKVVWTKNLNAEYGAAPLFFARGSSPLVWGDKLIVNVGSKPCVAAFDKKSGKLIWGAEHRWNASYASPVPAKIHGRDRVMIFAGGMTNPPHGGLLSVDPDTGKIDDGFPWRAQMFASVNAASPVVAGDSVFLTEGYTEGGVMVSLSGEFKMSELWRAPKFASQFSTPVAEDGYLYGFSGSSERGAELVCLEVATGREMWRDGMELVVGGRRVLLGRASLLRADGAFLCVGEQGTLLWLDLTPQGAKVLAQAQLWAAPETWGAPALSKGLLYVNRNARDYATGDGPAVICYDLRKPAD